MRRFFSRQVIPMIPQNQANKANIEKLNQLAEDLKAAIRSSSRRCCGCNRSEFIFGRLDQARYILTETFEGKQFFVNGPDGNKIDCMFFPCTIKEKVEIHKPGETNKSLG